MTKGPRRLVLDQYLDSAAEGAIKGAGKDWKNKADDLRDLGDALKQAAQQAELRIGEQTLTGPALRASMEQSSTSMITKAEQLRAAGEALTQVGQQMADTRETRDALADLGTKPSSYQAPAGTPGVEPTAEEIQAQADASQARQNERSAWQSQYDKQEATSLALTKEMDAAFLGAIPPMKEIHGQEDPTEPPPRVPAGPGGTYLPGTQAPPTGGNNNGGNDTNGGLKPDFSIGKNNDNGNGNGNDNGGQDGGKNKPPPTVTTPPTPVVVIETGMLTPPDHPTHVPTDAPTTTVIGSSQNGVAYDPTGPSVSAPAAGGTGGSSSGASAAALGAAGGAGGMAAGAIRPGSAGTSAASGSTPVRAIGSTGRAGSAGALSRSAGSSAAARSAGSAGSPASRSASSAAGRGASTGSSAGRGGAGGRGSGSGSGSRSSAGRGSSGARSGAGTSGSRGARKGERDQTTDRDSLVYDQDWLGDDDVAPGVLD